MMSLWQRRAIITSFILHRQYEKKDGRSRPFSDYIFEKTDFKPIVKGLTENFCFSLRSDYKLFVKSLAKTFNSRFARI